jgi:hypothetical protein
MVKFLIVWELDTTKMPADLKEIVTARTKLLNMVKDDLKSGALTEWGRFAGENGGYAICEGTEVELDKETAKYCPYVNFKKVYPILSVSQVEEVFKALSRA